ncbi:hypothetical protein RV18_GL002081 [Enterococcus termitis]|nr:hypothetical protein [Enterococcus termitis]OJG96575.1 hypothetical protein RV18_GL002081 [Enterococcus termitis]
MDKKALEKDYQQGVKLIQEYVTNYLVENYEGIEKIEWQGIGVEWRNSPIYGASLFSNYVDTDVKIYVSEDNYFTMTFQLSDEAEYNDDSQKYVLVDSLNSEWIDELFEVEKGNHLYSNSGNKELKKLKVSNEEQLEFERMKKSNNGSSDAEIHYDLKIHELNY